MEEDLNAKKTARQLAIIEKWRAAKGIGTLEACTGFGKTRVATVTSKRMTNVFPQAVTYVVVPTTKLYDDWMDAENGHIVKQQLWNVRVFVINTFINTFTETEKGNCDLLILDEIHNYASEQFGRVFAITNYKYILGLTATLERIDEKHKMIEQYCPIVDRVSIDEAKREGYISNFIVFNLGLKYSEKEKEEYTRIHDIFNSAFAKFGHNFDLAMACGAGNNIVKTVRFKEGIPSNIASYVTKVDTYNGLVYASGQSWRNWYANHMEWDGTETHAWSPKKISNYAQQFSYSMRERKTLIYKAKPKIEAVKILTDKFNVPTITFSEDSDFANKIEEVVGKRCKAYHTQLFGEVRVGDTVIAKGEPVKTGKSTVTRFRFVEGSDMFHLKGLYDYKSIKNSYPKCTKIGVKELKKEILDKFERKDGINVLSTVRALDEGYDVADIELVIMASYNSSKRQNTQRTGRGVRISYNNIDKVAMIVNLYMVDTKEEDWLKSKQIGTRNIRWINSVDEVTTEGLIVNDNLRMV